MRMQCLLPPRSGGTGNDVAGAFRCQPARAGGTMIEMTISPPYRWTETNDEENVMSPHWSGMRQEEKNTSSVAG